MDKLVHVKFEGVMDDLLVKIYPKLYTMYSIKKKGQMFLYATLTRPMYVTLRSSIIFWRNITIILFNSGYFINAYEWCVEKKIIHGQKCTIICHVDNLNIYHVSDKVLTQEIYMLDKEFGCVEDPLTILRGKFHDYLWMTIYY